MGPSVVSRLPRVRPLRGMAGARAGRGRDPRRRRLGPAREDAGRNGGAHLRARPARARGRRRASAPRFAPRHGPDPRFRGHRSRGEAPDRQPAHRLSPLRLREGDPGLGRHRIRPWARPVARRRSARTRARDWSGGGLRSRGLGRGGAAGAGSPASSRGPRRPGRGSADRARERAQPASVGGRRAARRRPRFRVDVALPERRRGR